MDVEADALIDIVTDYVVVAKVLAVVLLAECFVVVSRVEDVMSIEDKVAPDVVIVVRVSEKLLTASVLAGWVSVLANVLAKSMLDDEHDAAVAGENVVESVLDVDDPVGKRVCCSSDLLCLSAVHSLLLQTQLHPKSLQLCFGL